MTTDNIDHTAPKLFRRWVPAALADSPCEANHPETPDEVLEMAWWLRHDGMDRTVDIAESWEVPRFVVRAWLAEYAVRRALGRWTGRKGILVDDNVDEYIEPDAHLDDAECPHCFADAFRAKGTGDDFQCAGCHHRFPYSERSTRRRNLG